MSLCVDMMNVRSTVGHFGYQNRSLACPDMVVSGTGLTSGSAEEGCGDKSRGQEGYASPSMGLGGLVGVENFRLIPD